MPKAFVEQKRRKICLVVRRVHPPWRVAAGADDDDADKDETYEECVLRIMDPATRETKRAVRKRLKERLRDKVSFGRGSNKGGADGLTSPGGNGVEVVVVDGDDEDDGSVSAVPAEFLDGDCTTHREEGVDEAWRAKYKLPIKTINLKKWHKNRVTLETTKPVSRVRDLIFDTADEAYDFCEALKREKARETERAQRRLHVNLGGMSMRNGGEKITFLIEIVSAWNIPAGDITSSDPYVKCSIDGVQVHQTKYISKTYVSLRLSPDFSAFVYLRQV